MIAKVRPILIAMLPAAAMIAAVALIPGAMEAVAAVSRFLTGG